MSSMIIARIGAVTAPCHVPAASIADILGFNPKRTEERKKEDRAEALSFSDIADEIEAGSASPFVTFDNTRFRASRRR
jgi:hypothetical protein